MSKYAWPSMNIRDVSGTGPVADEVAYRIMLENNPMLASIGPVANSQEYLNNLQKNPWVILGQQWEGRKEDAYMNERERLMRGIKGGTIDMPKDEYDKANKNYRTKQWEAHEKAKQKAKEWEALNPK